MSLIKLSDGCYVAAEEVAEVKVTSHHDGLTVRMKNGIGHHLYCDYGQSCWATMDRLVNEINAAVLAEKAPK